MTDSHPSTPPGDEARPEELPEDVQRLLEVERSAPGLSPARAESLLERAHVRAAVGAATRLQRVFVAGAFAVGAVTGAAGHAAWGGSTRPPEAGHAGVAALREPTPSEPEAAPRPDGISRDTVSIENPTPSVSAISALATVHDEAVVDRAAGGAAPPSPRAAAVAAPAGSEGSAVVPASNAGVVERSATGFPPPAENTDDEGRGERSWIETARSAVSRGEPRACLAAVDAHAARFAEGSLAEEREALAVRCLAALGQTADARARAATFVARWPLSLYRPSVERAARE